MVQVRIGSEGDRRQKQGREFPKDRAGLTSVRVFWGVNGEGRKVTLEALLHLPTT